MDKIERHIVALNARLAAMQKRREVLNAVQSVQFLAQAHGFQADLTFSHDQPPDGMATAILVLSCPTILDTGAPLADARSEMPQAAPSHPAGDAPEPDHPAGWGSPDPAGGPVAQDADRPVGPAVSGGLCAGADDAPACKPTAGLGWTNQQERTAIAMKRDGASAEDIGKAIGRTCRAVELRFIRHLKDWRTCDLGDVVAAPKPRELPPIPPVAVAPMLPPLAPRKPEPAPARLSGAVSGRSPLSALGNDKVHRNDMVAHLRWLYARRDGHLETDTRLVHGLATGMGASGVAEWLGWTKDQVVERFGVLRGGILNDLHMQTCLSQALEVLNAEDAAKGVTP